MKQLVLLSAFILSLSAAWAQNNVVNGSFELWEDSLNYKEPRDWNTNNKDNYLAGIPVSDTTDAQAGDSAVVVRSILNATLNDTIAGILTNGTNNPDSLGTNGWQINNRPEKLSGYYKYFPAIGDSARVQLFMYKHDNVFDSDSLVAYAQTTLGAASTYTYFDFVIENAIPGTPTTIPDSYVILITSTKDIANPQFSTLIIDNLNFVNNVSSAPTLSDEIAVSIYPNPAEGHFVITSAKHRVTGVSILNAMGAQVQQTQPLDGTNTLTVNTNGLVRGTYFVQIQFENGAVETRTVTVAK